MEDIWKQVDLLTQSSSTNKNDEQYICACGGVKSFQYEFPTCTECGRVDDYFISDEAEWVGGPDSEDDPSRVGIPVDHTLYSESWGMGTLIVGKTCKRMAKISLHSSMNHRDRALHHAYSQFEHICKGKLRLTDTVIDQAKIIYRKFNEEKLTRGAIRLGIKANCVLHACNENGVARTLKEVADAFNIPVKDVSRTSEIFKEATGENTGTTFSSDIISRLFNNIDFIPDSEKGKIRMKIIKACEEYQNNPKLMGKTPKGIASAVIFTTLNSNGYHIERDFVSKICEVSIPTLVKIEKIIKDL